MKKIETSVGAYVLQNKKILIVFQNATKTWAFPKGHVENDENIEETLSRELYEETSISDFEIIEYLGEYTRGSKKDKNIVKKIKMFIVLTNRTSISPILDDILRCEWIELEDVPKFISYRDDLVFFNNNKHKIIKHLRDRHLIQ